MSNIGNEYLIEHLLHANTQFEYILLLINNRQLIVCSYGAVCFYVGKLHSKTLILNSIDFFQLVFSMPEHVSIVLLEVNFLITSIGRCFVSFVVLRTTTFVAQMNFDFLLSWF